MLALALSLVTPCAAPQAPPADRLDVAALAAWREHLAPRADEQRWREIPWRQTIGEGLRDAASAARPMLLWLMNGHPLGCT